MSGRGKKGKTMEGKGGPKRRTHGRQDKEEQKASFNESCYKNQKQTKQGKRQSSKQEWDKVAKENS